MLNSRLGLFTAALSGFNTLPEHPFSRSYGVILPSSLATVLSLTSGFSPCPPVSVSVRAAIRLALEAFLGSVKSGTSVLNFPRYHSSAFTEMGFASFPALLLRRTYPTVRLPYPTASLHCSNDKEVVQEYQPVIHRLRFSASA